MKSELLRMVRAWDKVFGPSLVLKLLYKYSKAIKGVFVTSYAWRVSQIQLRVQGTSLAHGHFEQKRSKIDMAIALYKNRIARSSFVVL